MHEGGERRLQDAGGEGESGTAAVLYGMLTTFSEALGGLDGRLAAIEAAVHARPAPPAGPAGDGGAELERALAHLEEAMDRVLVAVEGRQAGIDLLLDTVRSLATRVEAMGVRVERAREGIEELVRSSAAPVLAGGAAGGDAETVAGLAGTVRAQSELFEQRTAQLAAAVAGLRDLLEAHVEETSHSLGKRASEAGRRLATDLGLRSRPRQPPSAP